MPVLADIGGLIWLVVFFLIARKIGSLTKKGGKTPGSDPGVPDLEDFLRKLTEGHNPGEMTEEKVAPPRRERPTAPPARPRANTPVARSAPKAANPKPIAQRIGDARPQPQAVPPPPPPVRRLTPKRQEAALAEAKRQRVPTVNENDTPNHLQSRHVRRMLKRPDTLRAAILLREILGPPVSARRA